MLLALFVYGSTKSKGFASLQILETTQENARRSLIIVKQFFKNQTESFFPYLAVGAYSVQLNYFVTNIVMPFMEYKWILHSIYVNYLEASFSTSVFRVT